MNVYKSTRKSRKVTFKAFCLLSSVEAALQTICAITGMSSSFEVTMHMLVFECKTGKAMDIRQNGFVQDFATQVFADTGCHFEAELQELNVHAILQWKGIELLFDRLYPQTQISEQTRRHISSIILIMSITRLGTIIFRVSLKQCSTAALKEQQPYTQDTENAITAILRCLHLAFSTFESPFSRS